MPSHIGRHFFVKKQSERAGAQEKQPSPTSKSRQQDFPEISGWEITAANVSLFIEV